SLSDSSSSTGTQSGFLLDKNAPVKQYRFFEQTEEPFSGSGIDPINYGRLSYDGLNTGDSVVYHDFTIDGNGPLDLVPPQHRTAGHLYYQWIVPTVELPYDVSPGDYNMPEIAAGSGVAGEEDGFFTQMISQHSNCLIEMEVQLPEDELDNDTSICLWFRGGYGLWYFQKYRSFVFGFPGYLIGVYTVPEGDPFYDSSKIQKIGVKLVDHTMKFYLNDVEIGSRETGLEEAVVNPNIHGFGGVFCTGVMYKSFKITPIFGVSGKIKTAAGEPIEGVTVNLTGDATAATLTGRNGEYQFELPKETASYTVSPSFANHAFTPETRTVDITAATHPHGITGIDFAAADQGMRFEYIQPGTFLMGSPEDELGRDTDETQHEVTVTQPFYIQTTEVTRYRWKTVMGNVTTKKYRDREMDLPATSFSWDEIQDFIAALNSRGEGTYRLPTEAEWEYAARAGSITAFANGDISESSNEDPVLNLIGWYSFNSRIDEEPGTQESRRVGEKIPNAWGLYDMHGNVSEWCQDWYAAYPTESVSDPVGPSSGSRKVIRGGSYSSEPANCRSANREYGDSDDSRSSLGFRLIWTPEP
ncbi:MAG: SUMF1/EgtB/PvdO family nonheme iron enzyme, partial [bacterium]|nr:SUMF1/EgtB/PvdO family nonheme iron enzyme [bacterium]